MTSGRRSVILDLRMQCCYCCYDSYFYLSDWRSPLPLYSFGFV